MCVKLWEKFYGYWKEKILFTRTYNVAGFFCEGMLFQSPFNFYFSYFSHSILEHSKSLENPIFETHGVTHCYKFTSGEIYKSDGNVSYFLRRVRSVCTPLKSNRVDEYNYCALLFRHIAEWKSVGKFRVIFTTFFIIYFSHYVRRYYYIYQ